MNLLASTLSCRRVLLSVLGGSLLITAGLPDSLTRGVAQTPAPKPAAPAPKPATPARPSAPQATRSVGDQLKQVPVFTLTDGSGQRSITVTVPAKDGKPAQEIGLFFFSSQDAQAALQQVRSQNPQVGKEAQVRTVGLDKAYDLAKAARTQKNTIGVSLQAPADDVKAAVQLLQASGQKVTEFNGIPLFFATGGPQENPLTMELTDPKGQKQQAVPFFFSKKDLDDVLADMRKQDPKAAAGAKVQVSSLERIIDLLESSKDPQMQKIVLMPAKTAVEFAVRQEKGASASSQRPAGAATPAARPAAPAPKPTPAPQR